MLWLIFAILTAAAVACVVWPLAKSPRALARCDIGAAMYKAQLAEIERDEAQHIVAPEDALGAKTEAARRLLAAEAPADLPAASAKVRAKLAALAVVIFIPAISLVLYAMIGHPDMPDAPLSARLLTSPESIDLAAAVAKVEAHLTEHPNDGRGYEVLAPVYLQTGRAGDAVKAARAALRLLGETAERQALYGEAMVIAANGVVTPDARQAFETAAASDPAAVKPRFFLGLAAEQRGELDRAREIWGRLASEAPQESRLALALREKIAALSDERAGLQSAPTAKLDAAPEAKPANAIRAMVDGLAARLAQNGHDLEGWLRLVRSYAVLREADKARSALADAKRNHAGDPGAINRLDTLARELGLES
ncbi:MAG: c-type cytochrome biogenesis protein CcmI [Beijerinckiaceae bacterium]|nr:c-type cytochrome biogenesis protein CcmI [Beijerinckiaceae bacterium]